MVLRRINYQWRFNGISPVSMDANGIHFDFEQHPNLGQSGIYDLVASNQRWA